jgi:biopolymer transport protein ExbB/TolQ
LEELHNRTKAIIKELIGNIELKFEKTIDDLLKRYDEKISENQELLRNLESKNESILQKEEKRYQKLLSDFEANVSEEIKFFEEKLEDFESNSYQSTFDTIKTSLVYNFLFSSFVLLSGGFAEYTNSYVNDIANVGSLFAILIMGGLKWGVITFIIGIIISVFMVINNVHKKYVQKNSYLKRISNLNALKEKGKADLKKQYEDRKNSQNKKYTVTKQNLTEEIEAYKKSKAEEREKLKEKFKEDQSALQKPLEMLLEL